MCAMRMHVITTRAAQNHTHFNFPKLAFRNSMYSNSGKGFRHGTNRVKSCASKYRILQQAERHLAR
jgi:hypothetical protein